jgi:hypothetical protein
VTKCNPESLSGTCPRCEQTIGLYLTTAPSWYIIGAHQRSCAMWSRRCPTSGTLAIFAETARDAKEPAPQNPPPSPTGDAE